MSRKVIVYDNFYKDADDIVDMIRKDGNEQDPSKSLITCSDLQPLINSIIGAFSRTVDNKDHGRFKLLLNNDKNCIRYSLDSKWTCIVFLTDHDSEIKFWKNTKTNETEHTKNSLDITENLTAENIISGYTTSTNKEITIDNSWTCEQYIKAKKNQAIIFRSNLYYSIGDGCGSFLSDGRLIQCFFFGDNNAN